MTARWVAAATSTVCSLVVIAIAGLAAAQTPGAGDVFSTNTGTAPAQGSASPGVQSCQEAYNATQKELVQERNAVDEQHKKEERACNSKASCLQASRKKYIAALQPIFKQAAAAEQQEASCRRAAESGGGAQRGTPSAGGTKLTGGVTENAPPATGSPQNTLPPATGTSQNTPPTTDASPTTNPPLTSGVSQQAPPTPPQSNPPLTAGQSQTAPPPTPTTNPPLTAGVTQGAPPGSTPPPTPPTSGITGATPPAPGPPPVTLQGHVEKNGPPPKAPVPPQTASVAKGEPPLSQPPPSSRTTGAMPPQSSPPSGGTPPPTQAPLRLQGHIEKNEPKKDATEQGCAAPAAPEPMMQKQLMDLAADLDRMVDQATDYSMAATNRFFQVMTQAVSAKLKSLAGVAADPVGSAGKAVDSVVAYLTNDHNENDAALYDAMVRAIDQFQKDQAGFLANAIVDQAASAGTGAVAGRLIGCASKAGAAAALKKRAQAIAKAKAAAQLLKRVEDDAGDFQKLVAQSTRDAPPPPPPLTGAQNPSTPGPSKALTPAPDSVGPPPSSTASAPAGNPGGPPAPASGYGNNPRATWNNPPTAPASHTPPRAPATPASPPPDFQTPSAEMVFCKGVPNQCFPVAVAQAETWDVGKPRVAGPTAKYNPAGAYPATPGDVINRVLQQRYGGRTIPGLSRERQLLQRLGAPSPMANTQAIMDELWNAPNNSQGLIFVKQFADGDGHVFNVGKFNGQIVFKDMTGEMEALHGPQGVINVVKMDPAFNIGGNPAELWFYRVR